MCSTFGYGMAKEKPQSSGEAEATINASIAHVVLCCVAGQGITQVQGTRFGLNIGPVYTLSSRATRFLAIPCMMADLYKDNHWFGGLHLLSGLVPFTIAILGNPNDNRALGNLVVAGNIISLGGKFGDFSAAYKISLAASRYLPIPCLMADLNRSNEVLSCVHVISGLVPFALALSGSDNPHLGNMMIACNIIALAYHAYEKNKEWAWYTAGAATVAYFAAPQMGTMGPKVMYPLCLAVMEYCGHRVYHSNVTIVEPRK
ncbi:hypothetical protein MSG28_014325 [Choristoneura fumiferana]|uniref:Uncharacterized protein n=1 Tax=Choristoneura fumiferana TaxID=7141 RepID=A0ACC0JGR2_CHOFU|nr:hypothetical protein MSG28_014325 [Choristoneura fumiferana]